MLSKVLSKEACAECKFCCSFRRQSLWETPLFPIETVRKLQGGDKRFLNCGEGENRFGRMDLEDGYRTEAPEEEVPCSFLDAERGCMLSEEDKPFDCKIWPLRIMRKQEELVIALTPTCPKMNRQSMDAMKELVRNGLGDKIYAYAAEHPYIIKEYREGFPVLMKRE
ncbi:MAG: hypothetical protein J1E83_00155 [Lachnospiraceae bacterium]|nr:hypothetical protein [Lachnospiraceae bacterium]